MNQDFVMAVKRIVLVCMVISGLAFGQTTLRVPSTSSQKCIGADCAIGSQARGNGAASSDYPDQTIGNDGMSEEDVQSIIPEDQGARVYRRDSQGNRIYGSQGGEILRSQPEGSEDY